MTELPNPFLISALEGAIPAETAAAPDLTDPPVAAAVDIPLCELSRRGFDVERFFEEIEPLPLFLQAPVEVLQILAGY